MNLKRGKLSLNEEIYYKEAFKRNIGLLSEEEQKKLRRSRVAIAGLGGVGGVHASTLARLGIGKFNIADFDKFELVNFNRQVGATMGSIGKSKTATIKKMLKDINPFAEIKVFPEGINNKNIDSFLDGVDVVLDGLDFLL